MLAVRGAGEHYYAELPGIRVASDLLYELIAVHLRHVEVHQREVRHFFLYHLQRLHAVLGLQYLIVVRAEQMPHKFAVIPIVVHHQHGFYRRHGLLGRPGCRRDRRFYDRLDRRGLVGRRVLGRRVLWRRGPGLACGRLLSEAEHRLDVRADLIHS